MNKLKIAVAAGAFLVSGLSAAQAAVSFDDLGFDSENSGFDGEYTLLLDNYPTFGTFWNLFSGYFGSHSVSDFVSSAANLLGVPAKDVYDASSSSTLVISYLSNAGGWNQFLYLTPGSNVVTLATDEHHQQQITAVPGPVAGAGLPMVALGLGYLAIVAGKRRRASNNLIAG